MRARARGFTLVELLVVVSIIALLISILLPSLKKAREQSRNTVCMANMRELGLGFLYYAEDNRQQPPPNRQPPGTPPEYRDSDWWYYAHMVPKYIPSNKKSQTNAAFGGVFKCPADAEAGRAYSFNIYASNYDKSDASGFNNYGVVFNPVSVRTPFKYLLFGEAHAIYIDTTNPGQYGTRYMIGQQGTGPYSKFLKAEDRGDRVFYGYLNFARHKGRTNSVLCDLHVGTFRKEQLVKQAPANPGRWISTLEVQWSPIDPQANRPTPP